MIDATPALARLIFLTPVTVALVLLAPAPAAHAQPPPWRWPLPGTPEVLRGFDPPDLPWGSGHRGVDLGAYAGEPVYAPAPGRVTYVGHVAGHGIVTITHDTRRTTYLPVDAAVHQGDRVRPGTRIGVIEPGFQHCPTRICLHWGLLRGKIYLDPLALLPHSPIRLLPLTGAPPLTSAPPLAGGPAPMGGPPPVGARDASPPVGGVGMPPGKPVARFTPVADHTQRRPSPRTRLKPVADLAESALAGSGGAGLVLGILAAAGRAPWRRTRPAPADQAQLATAMRLHPAGGRADPPLAEIHPFPPGRHRKKRRLARLLSHLRRRRTPETPDTTTAEIIDLDAERRIRRPTQTDERDPA